jgi:hypothetical protein
VLGLFSNFSVAFTYLSPVVGVFSLFTFGAGMGGPTYVWPTWIPVAGMLLVALVFGELASHCPISGALYLSFGTSGLYLSFFLTVIGAAVARARGWVPAGKFRLGKWAWPVIIVFLVGAVIFALAKDGRELDDHLRDDLEKPAALK